MLSAEQVLDIIVKIPNMDLFFYVNCDYEEVVDMFTYDVFPITKEEFNGVKEYLLNHYERQFVDWKELVQADIREAQEEYEPDALDIDVYNSEGELC